VRPNPTRLSTRIFERNDGKRKGTVTRIEELLLQFKIRAKIESKVLDGRRRNKGLGRRSVERKI